MNIHYNTDWLVKPKALPKLNIPEQAVTYNVQQEDFPIFTALLNQQSPSDKNNRTNKTVSNHHATPLHPLLTLVQQPLIKTEPAAAFKPKKKHQQRHK